MSFAPNKIPPVEILRYYFRVDKESRLERRFASRGWVLASHMRRGQSYFSVSFQGKQYPAHRIIWALHHGREPEGVIDHINGKKWDNRIENLRDVTHAQNSWNAKARVSNSTGYRNVFAVNGGFEARVIVHYEMHKSPVFEDAELVGLVADEMRRKLRGKYDWSSRP